MMRRFLVASIAVLALFSPLATHAFRVSTPVGTQQTIECTVYVTRTGERYHKDGCRYLRRSRIELTRAGAIERGFTPCKVCGGSDCE